MTTQSVLIAGKWREASSTGTFQAVNPATEETLSDVYPVSGWDDCDAALDAAAEAAVELRKLPSEAVADFLERYAQRIEARTEEISETAGAETALPVPTRLAKIELPRTTGRESIFIHFSSIVA